MAVRSCTTKLSAVPYIWWWPLANDAHHRRSQEFVLGGGHTWGPKGRNSRPKAKTQEQGSSPHWGSGQSTDHKCIFGCIKRRKTHLVSLLPCQSWIPGGLSPLAPPGYTYDEHASDTITWVRTVKCNGVLSNTVNAGSVKNFKDSLEKHRRIAAKSRPSLSKDHQKVREPNKLKKMVKWKH